MTNSEILRNTEIILWELNISASGYLELLSPPDRSSFSSKWAQIAGESENLPVEDLLYQINALVYEYPALRQEFLGNINRDDIKFDPNAMSDRAGTQQNDDTAAVKIKNEVINAGKEIQIADEQLRDR